MFLSRDPNEHHQIVLATGRPQDLPFNVINQISFRVPDVKALRHFNEALKVGSIEAGKWADLSSSAAPSS